MGGGHDSDSDDEEFGADRENAGKNITRTVMTRNSAPIAKMPVRISLTLLLGQ
jgi:hypothetical protein